MDGVLDGALAVTILLLRILERSLKTRIVGGQASGPERLEELPLDTGLVAATATTITTATTIAIVITVALDVEVEDGIGVDQDHHPVPTTPTVMKAPASVQPVDAR